VTVEPLNVMTDLSDGPCCHKMPADILLEIDEMQLLKTKLGVLFYVVNILPIYSLQVSQGVVNRVYINYIQQYIKSNFRLL